jgi:hypothetical protein
VDRKIFGIGLSRTGTKSLAAALSVIGYKAAHYDVSVKAVKVSEDGLTPDYGLINTWDALTDIPITSIYRKLDEYYPGAKFILTVREKHVWLDSCERHYSVDRSHYIQKHGIDPNLVLRLRQSVYGQEVFSRERFSSVYDLHLAGVLDHFRDRESDLLVLDICAKAGWPELCGFLGKPVPTVPFPRENIWKALK